MIAVDRCFSKECFKCQRMMRQMQYSASVVLLTLASNYKRCLIDLQTAIFPEQTAKVFKTQFAENHSLLPGYEYFLYESTTLQTFLAVFK